MPKREAPSGCYWRGEVLWGRIKVKGDEYRWSLRTRDAATAKRRRASRRQELEAGAHYGERRTTYDAAFVAWSEHVLAQLGPTRAKRYAVSLKQIEGFLRPRLVDEIDRQLVSDIVAARRLAQVTTATIRRDLTALSSVLAYADDQGWREGNPALVAMKRLRERRDPIVLPATADIETVIARLPGRFAHLVRAAWLTGCRLDELVTAKRNRLDAQTRQLTVIGKGNKLRVVQLSDEAFAVLRSIPPNSRLGVAVLARRRRAVPQRVELVRRLRRGGTLGGTEDQGGVSPVPVPRPSAPARRGLPQSGRQHLLIAVAARP